MSAEEQAADEVQVEVMEDGAAAKEEPAAAAAAAEEPDKGAEDDDDEDDDPFGSAAHDHILRGGLSISTEEETGVLMAEAMKKEVSSEEPAGTEPLVTEDAERSAAEKDAFSWSTLCQMHSLPPPLWPKTWARSVCLSLVSWSHFMELSRPSSP